MFTDQTEGQYIYVCKLFTALNYNNLGTLSICEIRLIWAHFLNIPLINCLLKKVEISVSCCFKLFLGTEFPDFFILIKKQIFLVVYQNFSSLIMAHPKTLWNACNFKPWYGHIGPLASSILQLFYKSLTDIWMFCRFYNGQDCKGPHCQDLGYKEHYHCLDCTFKVFVKKEEMVRHYKWHKKREESLQHGFMRYSPMDDCSSKFGACTHNSRQTHYHCLQVS